MTISLIKVEWDGQVGTINEKEAWLACEAIERHVKFFELSEMLTNPKSIAFNSVSEAYAAVLGVAGIVVTREQVKARIMASIRNGKRAEKLDAFRAVADQLFTILMEGNDFSDGEPAADGAKAGNE